MRIPDNDGQFEVELRRFAPREVAPLPAVGFGRLRWRVSLALTAAIVVMVGAFFYMHNPTAYSPVTQQEIRTGKITLGSARAKLNQAASFEDAIDDLDRNSRPEKRPPLDHSQRALDVLGREE